MNVRVNKLFTGYASVRSTLVKKCVNQKEDLVITYKDEIMMVPYDKIKDTDKLFQLHKGKFRSRYNEGEFYELYDFLWKVNKQFKLL